MAASPNEDEAAAISAAVERFLAETATPAAEHRAAAPPWQRAALLEGVGGKGGLEDLEGGKRWLS
jgi:hypothetical protein